MTAKTAHAKKIMALKKLVQRPVVLVGMMGTGKSHVGRLCAGELGLELHDTDAIVEERAGMKIPEIFATRGEQDFRDSEREVVLDCLAKGACIIATGGGTVTSPDVLAAIRKRGHMVWLKAGVPELLKRVGDVGSRPLLKVGDPGKILADLIVKRESLYGQAGIHIDTDGLAPREVLEKLINSLYAQLNKANV